MANNDDHLWIPDAELVVDTSIAQWAHDRQSGDPRRVDFQVPSGFERYCRILNRVDPQGKELPWSHFSRSAGVPMHPGIQWHEIERECTESIGSRPEEGTMDQVSFSSFLQVVRNWSESDIGLIAGFWVGKYKFAMSGIALSTIRLGLQQQVLFRVNIGSLMQAVNGGRSEFPGILYPDDESWYMSTNTDYNSTLVGGSFEFVQALLTERSIETLEVSPGLDLTYSAD